MPTSVVAGDADQTGYADDIAAYRRDFRQYLERVEAGQHWRAAALNTTEAAMAHDAAIMAQLHRDGWNRLGWPESAGGRGGTEIHRAVYYEELGRAGSAVPAQHWTLETLGPALLRFAPRLAARYLPCYLRGEEWWGQCFSEPDAGSDLAALRTRAVHSGDGDFVVTGQKIWTSQGATATRLLALVRTGTTASRHRGLTMMLIDADAPGVTVRPIALASGRRELAEVFFDEVRVPDTRLVGHVDDGWTVAMYLMQFERGMYGYALLTSLLADMSSLRAAMSSPDTSAAGRERFARTYIEVTAAQARAAQTVRDLAHRRPIGPQSSIDKLLFSTAEREVHDLILDVRHGELIGGEGGADAAVDTARAAWWYSRAATIMGGTAEIQRGIIADHVLGLPREASR
ncbi:acyl-CoA dehydrogenase [Mycolicibacterium moriokaense]|nr:acyl-CoA dehydrogenase [Mycolicibacterium moriokaense]